MYQSYHSFSHPFMLSKSRSSAEYGDILVEVRAHTYTGTHMVVALVTTPFFSDEHALKELREHIEYSEIRLHTPRQAFMNRSGIPASRLSHRGLTRSTPRLFSEKLYHFDELVLFSACVK